MKLFGLAARTATRRSRRIAAAVVTAALTVSIMLVSTAPAQASGQDMGWIVSFKFPHLCLNGPSYGTSGDGAIINMWGCDLSIYNHEDWDQTGNLSSPQGGQLHVAGMGDGYCLDADTNTDYNGQKVQMWACNGSPEQQWYQRPGWNGNHAYQNGLHWPYGRCLDADANGGGDGTIVQTWACNLTIEQSWYNGAP